jgi:hypothetical protein
LVSDDEASASTSSPSRLTSPLCLSSPKDDDVFDGNNDVFDGDNNIDGDNNVDDDDDDDDSA